MADEAENILRLCSNLYFHFYFGLFEIFVGVLAIASRFLPPRFKAYHRYLGQAFLYATIVEISTSLYVRNDGFRWFIFLFLIVCITNLIIGHASIRHYQRKRSELVIEALQARLQEGETKNKLDVSDKTPEEGGDFCAEEGVVISESQTPTTGSAPNDVANEKLSIFRKIHAFSMVLSWLMVLGAGIMFVRRSENLRNCKDLYAVRDEFVVGAVVYETDDGTMVVGLPPEEL